jgi:hypothetical protein
MLSGRIRRRLETLRLLFAHSKAQSLAPSKKENGGTPEGEDSWMEDLLRQERLKEREVGSKATSTSAEHKVQK